MNVILNEAAEDMKGLMKQKIGVIFDMDGVIFDTERLWKNAFEKANIKYGLELDERYRQSTCGKSEVMIREELKNNYPSLAVDEYREFMLHDVTESIATGSFDVKNHFVELISYLKSNHIAIALATSSHKERAEKLFELKGLSISGIFDAAVFSEDVGRRSKPDPYIFLKAAERISINPENCYVLEDSVNGIEAAARGGFLPIMVVDLIEPNDYCESNTQAIIRDLIEIKDRRLIGDL